MANTPSFYSPITEQRPWGEEIICALVPGVATLKILKMKAGNRGRLQRHHFKDEAGYILKGTLSVSWVVNEHPKEMEVYLNEKTLGVGSSFHFPVGCIHQERALTDCTILEVSTPHRNDREGMEEQFGFPVPEDALPSTTPEEVTQWTPWW